MRKSLYIIYYTFFLVGAFAMATISCSNDLTYAEQKQKERDAISNFVSRDITIRDYDGNTLIYVGRINVIEEDQFVKQGYKTDTTKNEYVLFGNSGVYMQIRREGVGNRLFPAHQQGQGQDVVQQEQNQERDDHSNKNSENFHKIPVR